MATTWDLNHTYATGRGIQGRSVFAQIYSLAPYSYLSDSEGFSEAALKVR